MMTGLSYSSTPSWVLGQKYSTISCTCPWTHVIQAVQPVAFLHTRHAHRSVLQSVACEIVERQPVSSADNINGKKVDDGVNSIMMMLESKKNLNHRLQSLCESDSVTKWRKITKGETSKGEWKMHPERLPTTLQSQQCMWRHWTLILHTNAAVM